MHSCNYLIAGNATSMPSSLSNDSSQNHAFLSGNDRLDSLPRGEDKRKIDSYEKDETYRGTADIFSVACRQHHRREFQQGHAEGRRKHYCRWQTAPGGDVSSGMDWKRTERRS